MLDDRRERLRLIGSYLTARKSRWLLAAMILTGAAVVGLGSLETATPAATDTGGAKVQLWRLLAVGSAVLPVLTLTSPLDALEAAAAPPYHRVRGVVLAGAFALSSACVLLAAVLGGDPAVAPLMARALIAWFGLALVSGRVFGWNHSWILPCAIMCALFYWGHYRSGQGYRWWEFTAQAAGHLPSLLLALSLLAAGLTAYALSPWRIHRLARARKAK